MKKRVVNPGDRFNNWEIVKEVEYQLKRRFLCKHIEYGAEKEINLCHLVSGKSSGAIRDGVNSKSYCHGMGGKNRHPEYEAWQGMKRRCYNKNDPGYKNYGGRGVVVCNEWIKNYMQFYTDIGKRPSNKYSIERIDNNKSYSKDNCIWALRKTQNRNKRNSKREIYKGKLTHIADIAEDLGIRHEALYNRLYVYNMTKELAFTSGRLKRRIL